MELIQGQMGVVYIADAADIELVLVSATGKLWDAVK